MRVLLVTQGLSYGGAERIVEVLARDLQAQGDEVAVVATTRSGPIGDEIEKLGIRVHVLGLAFPLDARVVFRLADIIRRFRPDIIHSHLAYADIATTLAAMFSPARLVTTVHNGGGALRPIPAWAWKRALGRFDRVIAVSRWVEAQIGHPSEVSYPSLIDPDRPIRSRDDARRALDVSADTELVIAIGRLVPIKGFDVLAAAAVRPNTRYIVIGEGPERESLAKTRLELIGTRPDAASLLAAADVVVAPSRGEPFGLVALEAMASARPIVASAVGGLAETIASGETGLLVPPNDPSALAGAMDAMLNDRVRSNAMGQAGRERLIAQGWTEAAMLARTRATYLSLTRDP